MKNRRSWTPDRVNKLVEMVRDGYSASQIANALGGITRNAVIGKINRSRFGHLRPNRPATPHRARPAKPLRPKLRRPIWRPIPIPPPVEPPPDSLWISFGELEWYHCRWPDEKQTGAFRYCGCKAESDSPYCGYHQRKGIVEITTKSSDPVKILQRGVIPR